MHYIELNIINSNSISFGIYTLVVQSFSVSLWHAIDLPEKIRISPPVKKQQQQQQKNFVEYL